MYTRLAKAFFFFTIIFFIITFLYIYASLPETVAYEVNEFGTRIKGISRDAFFFVSMAIFVSVNLILVIPAKMVENQVSVKTRNLFKTGTPFRESMLTWVYSFAGIMNINLMILVFYILRINNFGGNNSSAFDIIYYSVPVLLLAWIIGLFILLAKKIQQVQATRLGGSNKIQ